MGGNAFGLQARRLSTVEHAALYEFCSHRLHGFFNPITTPRNLLTKSTHGDLDLICGWSGIGWDPSKGRDEGVVEHSEGEDVITTIDKVSSCSDSESLRRWCTSVARTIGATRWLRSGSEVSLTVPIGVIAAHNATGDRSEYIDTTADFYQVDLLLTPPAAVEFATFSYSYGVTVLLFSQLVRSYSRSLTLHAHHFVLRASPFPTLPAVQVSLTSSPAELCAWLGVDYTRWQQSVFRTDQDIWAWVSSVSEDSPAAGGLRRLAKGRKFRSKGHRGRASALDSFKEYLATSKWASVESGVVETYTLSTVAAAAIDESNESDKHYGRNEATPLSLSPTPTETMPAGCSLPSLDPDNPVLLDEGGLDALYHWGKKKEYDENLEVRRVAARILYNNQRARRAGTPIQATINVPIVPADINITVDTSVQKMV